MADDTGALRYTRADVLRRSMLLASSIGVGLTMGAGLPGPLFAAKDAISKQDATFATLLAGNLDFSFHLQDTLLKSGAGQNLFFSPLSISTALAMVYNGAAGSTQQAMARALAYRTLHAADVNAGMLRLLTGLRGRDTEITLSIADSIWLRRGLTVVPAFAAALKAGYAAGLQSLDFASPRTPDVINGWVSQQTHGLIPSIVKTIDPATVMFLVNALYFKAAWTAQFMPAATKPGPFTTGSKKIKTMPMMSNVDNFSYVKSESLEAIRLPYGKGQVSMYIVLPAATSSLQTFLSGLNAARWTALLKSLSPQHGILQMPRFSVSYGAGLKPALTALGMGEAFDPSKAAFPGIIEKQQAFISDVVHKAIMKVDEHGTLAAAVTSISVGVTAAPVKSFTMTVNRPFYCAIRDDVTGTLLFAGAIVDPS